MMNYRLKVILAIAATAICSCQAKPSRPRSSVPVVKGSRGKKNANKKKVKSGPKKKNRHALPLDDFGDDGDGGYDEFDLQNMVNNLSNGDDFYDPINYDSDDYDPRGMGNDRGHSDAEQFGQGSEKGALYDAYNLLHTLAQVRSLFFFLLQICSFLISFFIFHDAINTSCVLMLYFTSHNSLGLRKTI